MSNDDYIFSGQVPASKSLMNRALIVQSYFPQIKILGQSSCEDVEFLKSSLSIFEKHIQSKSEEICHLECGSGGTTFRFLALRVSREKGQYLLKASDRLLERPMTELVTALTQLGVKATQQKNGLKIQSQGWSKPNGALQVDRSRSSQFASAILLSSWDLHFPLKVSWQGSTVSDSYWNMTLDLVVNLGMSVKTFDHQIVVEERQKPKVLNFQLESDFSSAFSIAALAAICGKCDLSFFNIDSMQPDKVFVNVLQEMQIPCELLNKRVLVKKSDSIRSVDLNLSDCPDLFPVLAVLCCFAKGVSRLFGASQLVFKESNRIKKTRELLELAGFETEELPDGLKIYGLDGYKKPTEFSFNPDHDHRMAMAAGLLMKLGWKVHLSDPWVVKKSFPEFWDVIGVHP